MASADETLPQSTRCDICGAALGSDILVQEFADGSLAQLCTECAAGVNLEEAHAERPASGTVWPDAPVESAETASNDDPLEKTRELLLPVTDLIALQGEMQGALERLAASLERFALEMITESQGRSAVQSRVQELETELQKTRTQLSETEFLLNAAARPGQHVPVQAPKTPALELPTMTLPVSPQTVEADAAAGVAAAAVAAAGTFGDDTADLDATVAAPSGHTLDRRSGKERRATKAQPGAGQERRRTTERRKTAAKAAKSEPIIFDTQAVGLVMRGLVRPPSAEPGPGASFVPAQTLAAAAGEIHPDRVPTFRIEEVQAAQRYYNECPFVNRIRDVRRSLGKPKANLTRCPTEEPLAVVTITWDIVWYQYLVDMRRDLPSSADRVSLYREGMDLDELGFHFHDKNSTINDDGKLDASELEVRLLSDPSVLIPEMASEETKLLDDLTEETWGSRVAPEFKWDD